MAPFKGRGIVGLDTKEATVTIQEMPVEVLHRMVHESTVASARLEGREIPADYVRPARVQEFLDGLPAEG